MIVLACVDTIFFYFCFDYVLYFNFVTDFSLWLTCRAKQFSSADVEGILGDDKDAYGDVKGVRKLAKKSEKVYKKDRNTQIIYIFCFVTICTHKGIQYLLYNRF